MTVVNQPKALIAPRGKAVLVVVQAAGGYQNAPLLDERGHCLGYTRDDSWFTARLAPGEQVLHVKEPEDMLSVKVDLAAGKTYFLQASRRGGSPDLTAIRPGDAAWKKLDALLANGTQCAVDQKQCDATLDEMVWMPGQDLPKILAAGKKKAEAAGFMLRADDGVMWRGSARKSAR